MKKGSKVSSVQNQEKEMDNRFNIGNLSSKFVTAGGSKKAKSRSEDIEYDVDKSDDVEVQSDENSDIEANIDNEDDSEIQDDDGDDNDDGGDDDDDEEEEENRSDFVSGAKATQLREDAKAYSANLEKRGVVYMSRVPPFMKPNKARVLFEQFGVVTRIYLAEEDSQIRKRRKVGGGNGSKQFTEGWIEFSDKKIAKSVAESLNNSTMGEKFAYERRVRENKLKASMMQAKRSNAEFVELVEKGKQQKYVEDRKRKNTEKSNIPQIINTEITKSTKTNEKHEKGVKRVFRQSSGLGSTSEHVDKSLLSSVFAKRNKT